MKYKPQVIWPKIVMDHKTSNSCYLIGGLRPENQKGDDQCLKLNFKTTDKNSILKKKTPMHTGRIGCGVLLIVNFIYVTGGLRSLAEIDKG
jgi:hypothetical protein